MKTTSKDTVMGNHLRDARLTMEVSRGKFTVNEETFVANDYLLILVHFSDQSWERWEATAHNVVMPDGTMDLADPVTIEIKALGVNWILMGKVTELAISRSTARNHAGVKSTKVSMKGKGPLL